MKMMQWALVVGLGFCAGLHSAEKELKFSAEGELKVTEGQAEAIRNINADCLVLTTFFRGYCSTTQLTTPSELLQHVGEHSSTLPVAALISYGSFSMWITYIAKESMGRWDERFNEELARNSGKREVTWKWFADYIASAGGIPLYLSRLKMRVACRNVRKAHDVIVYRDEIYGIGLLRSIEQLRAKEQPTVSVEEQQKDSLNSLLSVTEEVPRGK